jgi:hypothetical protein
MMVRRPATIANAKTPAPRPVDNYLTPNSVMYRDWYERAILAGHVFMAPTSSAVWVLATVHVVR